MRIIAVDASELFQALADPKRLRIARLLAASREECCLCELVDSRAAVRAFAASEDPAPDGCFDGCLACRRPSRRISRDSANGCACARRVDAASASRPRSSRVRRSLRPPRERHDLHEQPRGCFDGHARRHRVGVRINRSTSGRWPRAGRIPCGAPRLREHAAVIRGGMSALPGITAGRQRRACSCMASQTEWRIAGSARRRRVPVRGSQ